MKFSKSQSQDLERQQQHFCFLFFICCFAKNQKETLITYKVQQSTYWSQNKACHHQEPVTEPPLASSSSLVDWAGVPRVNHQVQIWTNDPKLSCGVAPGLPLPDVTWAIRGGFYGLCGKWAFNEFMNWRTEEEVDDSSEGVRTAMWAKHRFPSCPLLASQEEPCIMSPKGPLAASKYQCGRL